MANVWAKPRYPIHIFGAREGAWPEIGPGPTELRPEQFVDAVAAAREVGVELDLVEVEGQGNTPGDEQVVDSTGNPAPVVPAAPAKSASAADWRTYAEAIGLDVPADATRTQIQDLVEQHSAPNTEA